MRTAQLGLAAQARKSGPGGTAVRFQNFGKLERAKRFELSTPTLARLCSTTELRTRSVEVFTPPNARGGLMADRFSLCKRLSAAPSTSDARGLEAALVDVALRSGDAGLFRELAFEIIALPGL